MIQKSIDSSAPLLPVIAERYSGVCFDPARAVALDTLKSLAEAARWAPSCFGDEPWRFLILSRQHDEAAWRKGWDCLMPGNQGWCEHAPVLVLIASDTLFKHNDKPNGFAAYDSGAAAMSFALQATALGLMTHQMGGFMGDKARELFGIPERVKPLAMMAVGYQLPADQLPEALRERELKPRKRQPLGDQFFLNGWGTGL